MLYSPVAQVFLIALAVVTVLVVVLGDGWGRASVLIHVLNCVLVAIFQRRHEHGVFQTADFGIDAAGTVVAVWIAVASGRTWAASFAGFQVLGVVNYVAPLLDRSMLPQVFIASSYVWEAGALASLLASMGSSGPRP